MKKVLYLVVAALMLVSFNLLFPVNTAAEEEGVSITGKIIAGDTESPLTDTIYAELYSADNNVYNYIGPVSVGEDGAFTVTELVDGIYSLNIELLMESDYFSKQVELLVSGNTVTVNNQPYNAESLTVYIDKAIARGVITKPDGTMVDSLFVNTESDFNVPNDFSNWNTASGAGRYKIFTEGYGKISYYTYDYSSENYGFSDRVDMLINQDGTYTCNGTPCEANTTQVINQTLPALQFKGKVFEADGTTVTRNAVISVKNSEGETIKSYAVLNDGIHDGMFMIGGLPDGTYELLAEANYGLPLSSLPRQVVVSGTNITVNGDVYTSDSYISFPLFGSGMAGIVGDLNMDGKIDISDLTIMSLTYGKTNQSTGWDSRADLNKDGIIDRLDFEILKAGYN